LRVGVSGHRVPPKLPTQSEVPLRAQLDRVLAAMVDAARQVESDAAIEFIVVSSLAEGADRIVAEAALAVGFRLQVVLPLNRTEYARDFETQASRAAFKRLLDRAAAVFEMDGAADERPRAYEAAGLFMLANIDLLIAIWDGEQAAGVGGTAEIVNRAIADGIFVVWLEPMHPNALKVSWSAAGARPAKAKARPHNNFRSADVATVARAVKAILIQPTQ
jgi:hypothetical protein